MGFINWLISGGATAGKVVDATINAGDALFFTPEEKSQANLKKLDWSLKYLKLTSGQNVARRLITVGVVGVWVILVLAAVISGYFDRGDDSFAVWVFEVIKDVVNGPFMIIVGFYFMTSLARAVKNGG